MTKDKHRPGGQATSPKARKQRCHMGQAWRRTLFLGTKLRLLPGHVGHTLPSASPRSPLPGPGEAALLVGSSLHAYHLISEAAACSSVLCITEPVLAW